MHKSYRIRVYKGDIYWCHIDIDHPWANKVVADIVSQLSSTVGYRLEIFEAYDERRITMTEPEGTKLLHREVLYRKLTSVQSLE